MQNADEGVLTVKLIFINDTLKLEILNAHCIRSMDSNGRNVLNTNLILLNQYFKIITYFTGFSDPFVKVRLVPQNKFQNVIKPKTAVQKKTLSPLFDECFKMLVFINISQLFL